MNNTQDLERKIKTLEMQRSTSLSLLKACNSQVGLVLGEEISAHVAELEGSRHNPRDFDMQDKNGEQ